MRFWDRSRSDVTVKVRVRIGVRVRFDLCARDMRTDFNAACVCTVTRHL